jgi:phage protein D
VTESFNKADSFSLSVRDRSAKPDTMFAGGDRLQWLDSEVFQEFNEVEIHVGYGPKMEPMLHGHITAVQSDFPSSGQPRHTVQGQSFYHRLGRRQRRKPFRDVTDSEIASEIARELDWGAVVDETQVKHPLVSTKGDTLEKILMKRAQRIGYEVAVKGRTLHFRRPRYLDVLEADETFEWGRDLISFSPRLTTHKLVSEWTVRAAQTALGKGKEPLVGTARAGDERVKLGSQTGTERSRKIFGEQKQVIYEEDIVSAQEAKEMALARLETQSMEYIRGTGSCPGNPALRAGMLIELRGLGQRFSGKYYVVSTCHRLSSSGYVTSFDVKRNAI